MLFVQVTENKEVLPALEMKEEEVNKLSCSSQHLSEWSSTHDCEYPWLNKCIYLFMYLLGNMFRICKEKCLL